MGNGTLKVLLTSASGGKPVPNAEIKIYGSDGGLLYTQTTDANGVAGPVNLSAPNKSVDLSADMPAPHYGTYTVEISAPGFNTQTIKSVKVFDTSDMYLPVEMVPAGKTYTNTVYDTGNIGLENVQSENHAVGDYEDDTSSSRIMKEVIIPDYITVHLNRVEIAAENRKVNFKDYIKNVASSEIYDNWPDASLEANILCIISFALNRVYTEWYRSRGYDFDITSSTWTDQNYVVNQTIGGNISRVVDRIFNHYLRRVGTKEPFFALYCDGIKVSDANRLSQWGSSYDAQAGMNYWQIIKKYFKQDLEVAESNIFTAPTESYPGTALRPGSTGSDVRTLQTYLNRISTNFPNVPQVPVTGVYDAATEAAVKAFQNQFGLTADGITGKATWYEVSRVYGAVKGLSELDSEGERVGLGTNPPTSVIREGDRNADVVQLQYILNYLATFYPDLPYVTANGKFDTATLDAVKAFQKKFGLTSDGVVGPATWQKLYDAYKGANGTIPSNPNQPTPSNPYPFPGTSIRNGDSGSSVTLIQKAINCLAPSWGLPTVSTDGSFGSGTEAAVKSFQTKAGLTADGVVGSSTWSALMNNYATSNCSGNASTPASPYPGAIIEYGDSGGNVTLIQKALYCLAGTWGLPSVSTDGVFGSGTEAAIKAFQSKAGLKADGIVGKGTWDALMNAYVNSDCSGNTPAPSYPYPGEAMQNGSSGVNVSLIQKAINCIAPSWGLPTISTDGVFGNGTEAAVKAYQSKAGLKADGIVGKGTWDSLMTLYLNTNCAKSSSGTNTQAGSYMDGYSKDGGCVDKNGYPLKTIPYPGHNYERGDSDSNVTLIQTALNCIGTSYGIPTLQVDGVYGRATRSAVEEFQEREGLKDDGIVGEETWPRLMCAYANSNCNGGNYLDGITASNNGSSAYAGSYPGGNYQLGCTGDNVRNIQTYLNKISEFDPTIPRVTCDGVFGPQTQAAVLAFQRRNGLVSDGVVGENTWNSIIQRYNSCLIRPTVYAQQTMNALVLGKILGGF